MSYEKDIERASELAHKLIQERVTFLQKKLDRLILQLLLILDTKDGIILQQKNSIYIQIQKIFAEIENELKGQVTPILLEAFNEIDSVISREIKAKFGSVKHKSISKRIGLIGGKILRNSPLGQLFSLQSGAESLKSTLTIASSMRMTVKKLRQSIIAIDSNFLVDKFKTNVDDFVLRHSRLSVSETAIDNGLDYFIYTNSLIATSRPFCKKHAGKVFSIEETKKWVNDPLLNMPEKWKSTYIPLVHMGGFNCRHFPKFITKETYLSLKKLQ